MKILISLVRPLKCRISASVGLWNEGMTNRYGEESADQSSTDEGPPKNIIILILLARPFLHQWGYGMK